MVLLVVLLWAFFGKVALTIQFYLWSEFGQEIKLNICCCCLSSPWLVEGMTGDDGAGCAAGRVEGDGGDGTGEVDDRD